MVNVVRTIKRTPRIFHILTEAEPFSEHDGGAVSRWVANTIRDDDALVLAPSSDSTWGFPAERIRIVRGFKIYKFLHLHLRILLRWPIRMRLLRLVLASATRDLRCGDIVWVHNRPEFAAALEPRVHRRGARLVLHLHNSHLVEFPQRVIRAIHADRYVFLTHFLEHEALKKFPDLGSTEVTYSGADRNLFYPRPSPPERPRPLVLYVGRLVPEKGVHVFVQAMRLLSMRQVPIAGVVLGGAGFGDDGSTPYIQQIRREAPPNLTFESYCSGVALGSKFREADFFCIPSIWQEALGLVVLEAMASALPVVATRSGGIPELLAAGGGLLVERNSAGDLADALERVATDSALRQRLAQEALFNFQKNFTWDVVRDSYRRITQSLRRKEVTLQRSVAGTHAPVDTEGECATFPTSA